MKKELANKEILLQERPILPPLDMSAPDLSYYEPPPMDTDVAGSSTGMGGTEEVPDYTTTGFTGTVDPRQTDIEKELESRIRLEVDAVVKECMEWEKHVLHLANLTYLKHGVGTIDYHMPTLPYPLIKQEVLLRKNTHIAQCPPIEDLGGYLPVIMDQWRGVTLFANQPAGWRLTWFYKFP